KRPRVRVSSAIFTALVLVPGITTVASAIFAPLIAQLESIGVHGFRALDLPCVNPSGPLLPNALGADIAAVRAALVELIDCALDIVLVGHSYGGAPCLAAAHGLWKSTQGRESKMGGVAKIALISAVITLPGPSVGGLRQEFESKHGAVEGPPPHTETSEKARGVDLKK
ncbi:hypothetical protein LTR60_007532, partial [Cryomyces antarcticus]